MNSYPFLSKENGARRLWKHICFHRSDLGGQLNKLLYTNISQFNNDWEIYSQLHCSELFFTDQEISYLNKEYVIGDIFVSPNSSWFNTHWEICLQGSSSEIFFTHQEISYLNKGNIIRDTPFHKSFQDQIRRVKEGTIIANKMFSRNRQFRCTINFRCRIKNENNYYAS